MSPQKLVPVFLSRSRRGFPWVLYSGIEVVVFQCAREFSISKCSLPAENNKETFVEFTRVPCVLVKEQDQRVNWKQKRQAHPFLSHLIRYYRGKTIFSRKYFNFPSISKSIRLFILNISMMHFHLIQRHKVNIKAVQH